MSDCNREKMIHEKRFSSKTWKEILIQAWFVDSPTIGKYYEIREVFDFRTLELGLDDLSVQHTNVTTDPAEIKSLVDECELEDAEYYASCALQAIKTHKADPKAVPVL